MNGPRRFGCGPEDVGLMALADRGFFEALLHDPMAAMRRKVEDGSLRLTEAEMIVVEALISARALTYPDKDPLELWEAYHAYHTWDCEDWPMSWMRGVHKMPPGEMAPDRDPRPGD